VRASRQRIDKLSARAGAGKKIQVIYVDADGVDLPGQPPLEPGAVVVRYPVAFRGL